MTNRWCDDDNDDLADQLEDVADALADQPLRSDSDISVEALHEAARRLRDEETPDRVYAVRLAKLVRRIDSTLGGDTFESVCGYAGMLPHRIREAAEHFLGGQ